LVDYTCHFDEGVTFDAPPTKRIAAFQVRKKSAITSVARELELEGLAPEAAIARVQSFFRSRFRYATTTASIIGGST
jgi:hypothetical protein